MAENDIYNNEKRYETFLEGFKLSFLEKPSKSDKRRKYYVRNKRNAEYVKVLHEFFEFHDTSYIGRNRYISIFLFICDKTQKDLANLERKDIDLIVTEANKNYKSLESKKDFIKRIKKIWKILFPEIDSKGRLDDTLFPYVVRHLKADYDKSKEVAKDDKTSKEEMKKILQYFETDKRIQALVSLLYFEFPRPQEILWRKIKDVELFDNYGKLHVTSHGKEGLKFIEIIESYPYVADWLSIHPFKNDPEAYLFINIEGKLSKIKQLKPPNINKHLRKACAHLKIKKPITMYSFKRNGISHALIDGEKGVDIQHKAGWSSEKQLKAYSNIAHEDTFKKRLMEKGLIVDDGKITAKIQSKNCICGYQNKATADYCAKCKRPLDRKKILEDDETRKKELNTMKEEMASMKEMIKEMWEKKQI